jgi:hypothetical protein
VKPTLLFINQQERCKQEAYQQRLSFSHLFPDNYVRDDIFLTKKKELKRQLAILELTIEPPAQHADKTNILADHTHLFYGFQTQSCRQKYTIWWPTHIQPISRTNGQASSCRC